MSQVRTSDSTSSSGNVGAFTCILPGASISTSINARKFLVTVPALVVMTLLGGCDASVFQVQQDLSKKLLGQLEGNKAIGWESGMAW